MTMHVGLENLRGKRTTACGMLAAFGLCLGAIPASGQQADKSASAASVKPAATQPAVELRAEVVEVAGDVHSAPVGTGVLDATGWKPVKKGDELASGTQVRTGLRSSAVLLFGDDTVVGVRRATLASIEQFYESETAKTVRLGLGYGAVRGGTTEGELRTDVIVDSPVATLAKRGTEGWEMEVEPYTGAFRVSLARSGLVEALQKHTGQRRMVRAGEYANEVNIASMWVNQAVFDRAVHFVSASALSRADADFSTRVTGGVAPVAMGGGTDLSAVAGRGRPGGAPPQIDPRLQRELDRLLRDLRTLLLRPPLHLRPEGNFGVRDSRNILMDSREAAKLRRKGR